MKRQSNEYMEMDSNSEGVREMWAANYRHWKFAGDNNYACV